MNYLLVVMLLYLLKTYLFIIVTTTHWQHTQNDQGLTSPVTDRTPTIDSFPLSTIPDGSTFTDTTTTLESANTEPLGVENGELLACQWESV